MVVGFLRVYPRLRLVIPVDLAPIATWLVLLAFASIRVSRRPLTRPPRHT